MLRLPLLNDEEKKQLSEIKKIISKVLTKTDLVLVSRIQKKHFEKIVQHCKNNKLKIKKGKNTRTLLIHQKVIKKTKLAKKRGDNNIITLNKLLVQIGFEKKSGHFPFFRAVPNKSRMKN